MTADRVTFTLRKGSKLHIEVTGAGGAGKPILVYVHPAEQNRERTFPWYSVNPIEVWPGQISTVEGLPEQLVSVRAFGEGISPERDFQNVNLRKGRDSRVQFRMRSAPTIEGRVTRKDEPVSGAVVRLEAPNQAEAMLRYLRTPSYALDSEVYPLLPSVASETTSGSDGSFRLTAWESVSTKRYLSATAPDGLSWAAVAVGKGNRQIELKLGPLVEGDAELVLALPGRHQAIAAKATVNGVPREELAVGPEDDLVIDGLLDGLWSVDVRWHGRKVYEEQSLVLRGEAERELSLPSAAIDGQDEDTWIRAGRVFPTQ